MRKLSMILATTAGLGLLGGAAAVPALAQVRLYIGTPLYVPYYQPYGYNSRPYYYQPYNEPRYNRYGNTYPYYNQYSYPYYSSPGYYGR